MPSTTLCGQETYQSDLDHIAEAAGETQLASPFSILAAASTQSRKAIVKFRPHDKFQSVPAEVGPTASQLVEVRVACQACLTSQCILGLDRCFPMSTSNDAADWHVSEKSDVPPN